MEIWYETRLMPEFYDEEIDGEKRCYQLFVG